MDRVIHYSFFSLDNFFPQYKALSGLDINGYHLLTVLWNIILASIPLIIFFVAKKYWRKTKLARLYEKIIFLFLLLFWLLFLPNAAYIMSDIRHLINYCPIYSPYRVCVDNAWMIMFFFAYSTLGWVA